MKRALTFSLILCIILTAASACRKEKRDTRTLVYDFSTSTEGWNALFSDYPVGNENFYELQFERSDLPAPVNPGKALKISGNNHSDDLLSVIYKKIDGLLPNTAYDVTFTVDLASNVRTSSLGVGGSPDLMLGAGGMPLAPSNNIDQSNYYRPNFASSLQSGLSNSVFETLGRIGVSPTNTVYTLINRTNMSGPIVLLTNSNGELWLMIGTDSGFEGVTTLYYSKIAVKLVQILPV